MKKKVYLNLKVKSIISALVILGILIYAAPIKAADKSDVIAGIILGGIIGSEIQKDKQQAPVIYHPHTTKAREFQLCRDFSGYTDCSIPGGGYVHIPDVNIRMRNFDPRNKTIVLGQWRWCHNQQAWILNN